MKMKSHFNFAFAFDKRSLQRHSVKNAQTFYSLRFIIYPIVLFSVKIVTMGPLQLAVTWYKMRHAGEQATHWDIKNKENANLSC